MAARNPSFFTVKLDGLRKRTATRGLLHDCERDYLILGVFFPGFIRSVILKTWEYRCPRVVGSFPISGSLRLLAGCYSGVSRMCARLKTFTSTALVCFCLVWPRCCVR